MFWWTQEWWELKPRLEVGEQKVKGLWGMGAEKSRPPGVWRQQRGGTRGTLLLVGGEGGSPRHLCGLSFPNRVQPTQSHCSASLSPLLREAKLFLLLCFPTAFFLLIKGETWILVLTLPSQAFWRPNLGLNLELLVSLFSGRRDRTTRTMKFKDTVRQMPRIIIAYFRFNTHRKWEDPVTEVLWTISATLPSRTQHLPPIKDGWDGVKKPPHSRSSHVQTEDNTSTTRVCCET